MIINLAKFMMLGKIISIVIYYYKKIKELYQYILYYKMSKFIPNPG